MDGVEFDGAGVSVFTLPRIGNQKGFLKVMSKSAKKPKKNKVAIGNQRFYNMKWWKYFAAFAVAIGLCISLYSALCKGTSQPIHNTQYITNNYGGQQECVDSIPVYPRQPAIFGQNNCDEITKYGIAREEALASVCRKVTMASNMLKSGQYIAAANEYKVLVTLFGDNPLIYFDLANALLYANSEREAIHNYLIAMAMKPYYFQAMTNCGIAYYFTGIYDSALILYNRALAIAPSEPRILNNLGLIYFEKGKNDSAISIFCRAVEYDSFFAEAYNNLAAAYAEDGNYMAAKKFFWKANKLAPDDKYFLLNLGGLFANEGNVDSASFYWRIGASKDSNSASFNREIGILLYAKRDLRGAIGEWSEAIKREPHDYDTRRRRINALWTLGEMDKVIEQLKTQMRQFADSVDVRIALSKALIEQKDYKEAISILNQTILRFPNDPKSYINLGWIYETLNQYEDAIKTLSQAQGRGIGTCDVAFNMGNIYYKQKKYRNAIAQYLIGLRFNPNYSDIYANCGEAYKKIGNDDSAMIMLKKGLELNPSDALARRNLESIKKFHDAI